MADDLNERTPAGTLIRVELSEDHIRYGEREEGHLFRIVQEASENALRHADADLIRITGVLEPGRIDLMVEDDGAGFEVTDGIEFASLLANRHYGLVTMYERAALIGATLQVHSQLGAGTVVHVVLET
jgi:signal transduction histidine kinase